VELGSLHSGRDVVRLGGQQIENAILGNFEKKFPFHTTAMPCQEDRLAVVSIEKKTDRQMSLMNIRVKSRPHCLVFPSQACVKQRLPYIFKEI